MPAEGVGVIDLEPVEAGKALHFDELWLPLPVGVDADPEVKGEEVAVVVLLRDPVAGGDGPFGQFCKRRVGNKVYDALAGVR